MRAGAVALVVAAAFPSPAQSQTSSSGQVQFSCTFASSPTECGFSEQAKWLPRAGIAGNGRDGNTALWLHTEPGDNNVYGSGTWERDDVALPQWTTNCYQGVESWWSHS